VSSFRGSTKESRLRGIAEARARRGPEKGPFLVYLSEEPAMTYVRSQAPPKMFVDKSFAIKSSAEHYAEQTAKTTGHYAEVWPAEDAAKYMGVAELHGGELHNELDRRPLTGRPSLPPGTTRG
jgi:hypothetical protein